MMGFCPISIGGKVLSEIKDGKKDTSINPSPGELSVKGLTPITATIRDELKAIHKVNMPIFLLIIILIVLANLLSFNWDSIYATLIKIFLEVVILYLGIYYVTTRIIRIISAKAKGSGEGTGQAKAEVIPKE